VLICHGIGEVVEHWARSQELLAEHGVSSLVFNYSGCGRSGGSVSVERCEQDAMAACFWLRERLPGVQIILLGFSLGSGVAAAVVGRVPVAGLVMGEAYPSFREAVRVAGAPSWVTGLVPDAWRSEETLGVCKVPVLVVHGECDRLFPVSMGERLARAAGQRGKLVVVPGMGHSDLHAQARAGDWQAIVSFVCEIAPPGKSEIKA
jgi:alpha-beta hydrolase superfamily lysophospholipase